MANKDYQTFVEQYPSGYSVRVKFGSNNRLINTSEETQKSKEKSIAFAKRLADKNKGSFGGFKDMTVSKNIEKMASRVKDYSYIKRSDISVLKATIDGKVLNVDPKTILSGTYVAGKVKATASKLRVAKLDPSKLRDKILNYAKDFYATEYEEKLDPKFDKYIKVEDLKRFIECGLTEEMIMVFYCGWKSVMDIKADGEFLSGFAGGVFTFGLDEDGKYVKNWVKRGLYNCENNVYELGFKYPNFDWKKVGLKLSKTEIIETPEYEWFGKQRQNILKVETFRVKTNFTVIAVGSVGNKENGKIVESSAYGTPEERDPKNKLDLNSSFLALVSRNGKELFALAKKLLSQPKGYVKDFDWLVQGKTSGAEELKEANFKFAKGGAIVTDSWVKNNIEEIRKIEKIAKQISEQRKDDRISVIVVNGEIVWSDSEDTEYTISSIKGEKNWNYAMILSSYMNGKRLPRNEDIFEMSEYKGINYKFANGGAIETITRLNGNQQEYTLPLPKVVILTSQLNDNALNWIEENTGLKFKKTGWGYEAQPTRSEQIVKLILMYGFVNSYHNNTTNKNVLFLKFFKDEFMKYEFGGNVRTMQKGDAVVYRDKTWYITEKDGVVGIVSMRQGAWGSNYPFIPLTKIIQEQELTDMYGRKVFIPYSFDKANVGMLVAAKQAKELVPKSFDSIDTKIANRVSKKTFAERMSETGNEEYDRDAYSASKFAKGGMTEHGLRVGDKIVFERIVDDLIEIKDANGKKHLVDLDTGRRIMSMAMGGGIEDDYISFARTNARESIDWNEEVRNYAGDNYDSLTEEEKESIIAEMQMNWDYQHSFAKGGVLSEAKYISREEIVKVELKNGKTIENSYNSPIYSGLRIGKGITEREEMEAKGQTSLFKRGGTMPKYAKYVSQREIAKVYIGDEDEPKVISGRDLIGGVWYDNEKTEKLIATARKQGLIK